jgi:hypothetical protein
MKINIDKITTDGNILLSIEKTLNSNQNVELKNSKEVYKIKKLTFDITECNNPRYQKEIDEIFEKVKKRIHLILDTKQQYEISLISYFRPKNFNLNSSAESDIMEDFRELRLHGDIYDEIALNAITLIFTDSLRTLIPDSNYGNNLDEYESKNFFRPYFTEYKKFSGKRFEFLSKNRFNFLSTFDIKKYYDRIKFSCIENIVFSHYNKNDDSVKKIMNTYKLLSHNGLPQGPLFSHFFSTLLLWDLKEKFKLRFPTYEIISYVDDINIFYNSTSLDDAYKIDRNISEFLSEYLRPKLNLDTTEEPLNKKKHQIIEITENNYLSNIMLQLSAFDELRKDESSTLNAFDREELSKDLESLFEEMIDEIKETAKKEDNSNADIFSEHTYGNIVEKTSRFRTYRQLLLVNTKKDLESFIKELIKNDSQRQENGLINEENILKGSMFDKSFENYIRAIIATSDTLNMESIQIEKFVKKNILDLVTVVFKKSKFKNKYHETFKTVFNNLFYEYQQYKNIRKKRQIFFNQNPYIKNYEIESFLSSLMEIKNSVLTSKLDAEKYGRSIFVKHYLKLSLNTMKISIQQIKGKTIFREVSVIRQLQDFFMLLIHYDPTKQASFCCYDKHGSLLKVYEYRILNLISKYNASPIEVIDKLIDILNHTLIFDDNESCDPLIQDTINVVAKKLRNNLYIDTIITAHHFVRDLWKNGARDLPFYTLHNHEHSVELIRLFNRINLQSNGIFANFLNDYEYYTLIMSIYFHDLGMLYFDYDNLRKGTADKSSRDFEITQMKYFTTDLHNFRTKYNRNEKIEKIIQSYKNHKEYRSNFTRFQHHYNTTRFEEIEDIVADNLGSFVKEICYNHGVDKSNMKLTSTYKKKQKIEAEKVTVYLRFLDGLDNCKNRVSKTLYNTILNYVSDDDVDKYTITHWAKHLLIDEIKYSKIDSVKKYSSDVVDVLQKNVRKAIDISIIINEKINTTMQSSKPKKGCLDIIEISQKKGYIIKRDQIEKKSIFEKFINEYFFWTYEGIVDMSTLLEKKYGLKLLFSYEMGTRKMKYSDVIFKYLQ